MTWARWMLALAATTLALLAAWPAVTGWQARRAGAELFSGQRPLDAHIAGAEDDILPPSASRCSNCHAQAAPGVPSFGPRLGGDWLAQPRARRGGPPSRYDAAALCKLLRDGIDPAWVTLPRAMPRYEISDGDCDDLWAYLRSR